MRRYPLLGLIICLATFLTGCATHRNPYPNMNLSNETWQSQVDRDTSGWTRGADNWFLTGDPNCTELQNRDAPYSSAMSTMMVKVSNDVTRVRANGVFQVQIFGTNENNSVFLYGPNKAIREVAVSVHGNVLDLNQTKDAPRDINRVIVRVGLRYLTELYQANCSGTGCGLIEGIRLNAPQLRLRATGNGNIYLSGDLNPRIVLQEGGGTISLMGVNASNLRIISNGVGTINLSGHRVDVSSIIHHNRGNVNIIGATSNGLTIAADGGGKIGMIGSRINLVQLNAKDNMRVYLMGIGASSLSVASSGRAMVGLNGYANTAHLFAVNHSKIFARTLGLNDAFVRVADGAHINVTARNRLFASASGSGSIYYYGQPDSVSQFVNGSGVVIPIWNNVASYKPLPSRYKDSGKYRRKKYRGVGEGIPQSIVSGSF